jgi:hypothetical protein
MKNDLSAVERYMGNDAIEDLKKDFSPKNFMRLCKTALLKVEQPRITVEHFFKGAKSGGPKKNLFPTEGRTVANFECTRFINFWYPHKASEMIADILEGVREAA